MTGFIKGVFAGLLGAVILFGVMAAFLFLQRRDRGLLEYAEKRLEVERLREDYGNRDPYEFLDGLPGVRGAADGGYAEFERRRDGALQRFRDRLAD